MKEKREPQTKANVFYVETKEPKDMMGLYLAEPLYKKWTEDFKDEDTDEIISIERTELLYNEGTYVNQDTQQRINFYYMDGTITEPIKLTNQRRQGFLASYNGNVPFYAKVYNDGKTRKYLLRASGLRHAIRVVEDYQETRVNGPFFIKDIGRFETATFVEDEVRHMTGTDLDKAFMEGTISFQRYCEYLDDPVSDKHPDKDQRSYWQMEYAIGWKAGKKQIVEVDSANTRTFIVHSVNTYAAQKAILRTLTSEDHAERSKEVRKVDGEKIFTLSLQEAKQLPISAIIPTEYTEANKEE